MNKRLFQLSLLLTANILFSVNAQNQVANSDFEVWETVATNEQEPVNWSSFRTCYSANILTNAARGKQVDISPVVRPGSQGTKSAIIWARSILSIPANGNLTTGQIQAGSTTAANLANHNKTIRSNPDFNMPFTARPDSLTVWAKYIPKNTSHQARIAAVIHGDYDYREPNNGSDEIYVVGRAALDYSATDWQRLSIPFDYNFASDDPQYMLISITTNKTPGTGSIGDSVYVDDMFMIYNPTLNIENIMGTSVFKSGDALEVTYTITGTMSPYNLNADANVVSLELSDVSGSFDNPIVLDFATTNESGIFTAELPENLENGNYKLRVVTTNYPMISEEINITVNNIHTSLKAIENTVSVYPNPVSTTLFVEGIEAENAVIYTLSGMKVAEVKATKSGIDVSNYAKGSYFISIEAKDGSVHKTLFVKE